MSSGGAVAMSGEGVGVGAAAAASVSCKKFDPTHYTTVLRCEERRPYPVLLMEVQVRSWWGRLHQRCTSSIDNVG